MNAQKVYMLNSTGRQVFLFPWESRGAQCPWDDSKYIRVLIPLNAAERRNSNKKVHTQIIRRDNLREVRQMRMKITHGSAYSDH